MKVQEIRKHFPGLQGSVYGKQLVYLDNAATSQRPDCVMDKWTYLSSHCNANLHRAVHHLAELATKEYEDTRDYVARYINASCREEIVFTSGTTASINLAAFSFGEAFVQENDEVIVSEAEHHSDIVPWQMMCQRKKAVLKVIPVNDYGELDIEALRNLIGPKTRLVCVTHISNVLGIVNPVKEIVNICHSENCFVLIDGAQGIVHSRPDMQDLGCDFYVFSGHKIYAAPGTGVLYCRKDLLEQLPPYMGGGEMISSVKWTGTSYTGIPHRFEAGTQNMSSVPTLVPALELASEMEMDSRIKELIYNYLTTKDGIHLFGTPKNIEDKIPLFSFTVKGVHHEDLALILDKMGIAVRSGQMCAEPLMDHYGVSGMLRASFAPYNTVEEAEYFITSLEKAINMLR